MTPRPSLRIAAMISALVWTMSACGSSAPSTTPTASVPPPPAAPKVGICRVLTYQAATATSDDSRQVPCTTAHTSITVSVGALAAKTGRTTNLNSAAVQHRLAVNCPKAVETYTGSTGDTFDLSLIQPVWFIPTAEQISRGANWYRCDLVVLAAPEKLASVTATLKNSLASSAGLDRWGACANTAPSSPKFQRELCSAPHAWRAVSTVPIPPATTYLSSSMSATGTKECRKQAAAAAKGALKYSWSFEWPNKPQWEAGRRFGLCWLERSH